MNPTQEIGRLSAMRLLIEHETTYRYVAPVRLTRHVLHLRPRADARQTVLAHELRVRPDPIFRTQSQDDDGNPVVTVEFEGETSELVVAATSEVRVRATAEAPENPTRCLLPFHGGRRQEAFGAYLDLSRLSGGAHAGREALSQLSEELAMASDYDTLGFLNLSTQWLHARMTQVERHSGAPRDPAVTLALGEGACRDVTLLFMALCRHAGLPCRFVSGYYYQPDVAERSMHAWMEAYVPDLGWFAYDPSLGLPAGEAHVAVAASAHYAGAAPISGGYFGPATGTLDVSLKIAEQKE